MQPTSLVMVTGAGGFIGKVLVAKLLARGWRVKAMVRQPCCLGTETVIGDMRDENSLQRAMKEAEVVVHLAAAKSDQADSEDTNVGGARRLVAACRAVNCRRVINVSTQSVKIRFKGVYAKTKTDADVILHNSGLDVTTLMPSIVYGAENGGIFGTVLNCLKKLPIIPILGDGRWISAPIHVDDVAEAIVACIEHDNTIGKSYDLGGPEQISFDDLIDKLANLVGLKRPKVHIPFGLALFGIRVLSRLLPKLPITASNVLGSNQNTDIDIGPGRRDFGFSPLDLHTGLRLALKNDAVSTIEPVSPNELSLDSCILARYLLDVELPPELQHRYAVACTKVLGNQLDPEWCFVQRHPWTLPFIDAGAGILRQDSGVRHRLLLMTAILEATPLYADFFLAPPPRAPRFIFEMALQCIRCTIKVAVGIPLFAFARRP